MPLKAEFFAFLSSILLQGLLGFTDTVDFQDSIRSLTSYSRAEENARFVDGVRDDDA